MQKKSLLVFSLIVLLLSCDEKENQNPGASNFTLTSISIDGIESTSAINAVSLTPVIQLSFSEPIDIVSVQNAVVLKEKLNTIQCEFSLINGDSTLQIVPNSILKSLSKHDIYIDATLKAKSKREYTVYSQYSFTTEIDETDKFPRISDEELLTLVQEQTFKYFYDFAHPTSGMARERNTSGDIVTSGGSGFGIMALIVGAERNFISKQQAVERMNKIVSFLEDADRFHGAWSHWINGNTGTVVPFSTKDNGGDLVETSFLVQGLITFRQYLQPTDTVGNNLINRITDLYYEVEWDWYRKNNEEILYWHWSPNFNWDMNFQLSGYFEQQVTYFLAAASPTHGIPKSVYTNGFARNGNIVRNDTFYNIPLKLGGLFPLFWVHYSYLGLDPHFSDGYADYWEQNVNASLINQAHCIANPRNYVGYSDECWGLTSSDNQNGYNAHSPGNDLGVITPTAALSSFPYTPTESMKALKFFYYTLGDRTWGEYGFYDSFNLTQAWFANSYLAIDQGPIIVMIENHRTGLLWDLFMSAPEVQEGFTKLEFTDTSN
ncbi:hypothetical protein SanaruYs_02460 [Chryseotalea sanaruensis]|uniref:Beta-glucosidase n=1 Tax=Chryseotalea sanaruensis TaxID=2482724 RepID=A0A401U551_9BACT|nr:glucoamylase family protein [Chryseotalea sanaruensis]GCC50031.1 hypothetical protein SanaruYs_02460 [Chryseotalea sanaruensis]